MPVLLAIGIAIAAFVLIRLWSGAMNVSSIENQSLADVESKHPYLPGIKMMIGALLATGVVIFLSMWYGKAPAFADVVDTSTAYRSLLVFLLASLILTYLCVVELYVADARFVFTVATFLNA
jgi:hypothetical protein